MDSFLFNTICQYVIRTISTSLYIRLYNDTINYSKYNESITYLHFYNVQYKSMHKYKKLFFSYFAVMLC